LEDFQIYDDDTGTITIKKQPPNLYNPLDQQEQEAPAEPAKETVRMELPWQDISTLKDYEGDLEILAWNTAHGVYVRTNKDDVIRANLVFTHWLPITPPKAPTVEVPVEPERVSAEEFIKDPLNK
jgi:hypothetical protein